MAAANSSCFHEVAGTGEGTKNEDSFAGLWGCVQGGVEPNCHCEFNGREGCGERLGVGEGFQQQMLGIGCGFPAYQKAGTGGAAHCLLHVVARKDQRPRRQCVKVRCVHLGRNCAWDWGYAGPTVCVEVGSKIVDGEKQHLCG